ncbi:hypothetical protein PsYK624_080130 [Phanerochaete sordida]|uniref:Uncharacterized protein n=1 Tax=Phanerochaete sordida TaxID=48140 RepID=A0A9P3GC13_9APHY|nr:hypothetical protein PsYK624_080130 [Phanerochaete sordida]
MPTFIRLPPPEFPADVFRKTGPPSIRTPSISERPSSRSSLNSSKSFLPDGMPPTLDDESYMTPSLAPLRHTCEGWTSWAKDDSTEALLPAPRASPPHLGEPRDGPRPRSGTEASAGARADRDCAACRSYAAAKRAVTREEVIDAWRAALPARRGEPEWDAASQASDGTVSSASTGCFSIHDERDTTQWFIPHHGPNAQWLASDAGPDDWDDEPHEEAPAIAGGVARGGEEAGVALEDAKEPEEEVLDDAKGSKKRLSKRVLSAMLPCIPVS